MKQITIMIIMINLICGYVSAQHFGPAKMMQKAEGYGGFMMGILYHDMGKLNTRLKDLDFNSVDSVFTTIGGGGYGLMADRFMMGGSGYAVLANTSENDTTKAEVHGAYGFFELGYAVIKTKNFGLFPMLGFGGGSMKIKLSPQVTASPEFDEILEYPARNSELSTGGFAMKIGLRNHFSFEVKEEIKDGRKEIFKMGGDINIGAIYIFNDEWETDNIKVFDSPKLPKIQYHLSVTILFGGSTDFTDKKEKVDETQTEEK